MSRLLGLSLLAATASAVPNVLQVNDPSKSWYSLSENLEFQPADAREPENEGLVESLQRRLMSNYFTDYLTGSSRDFQATYADSQQTYYDDAAQAWRLLGLYVDCSSVDQAGMQYYGLGDDDNQYNNENDQNDNDQSDCNRVLLWAAYVDPDYEGNGLYEYAMYDDSAKNYNYDGCNGNERCQQLNCHEGDSKFELLGIFKEPAVDEWMELLFYHQGSCVWTSEDYAFMQTYREVWPVSCTESSSGSGYYYAMKPMPNAQMGIGIYADQQCRQEVSFSEPIKATGGLYPTYDNDENGNAMYKNATSEYSLEYNIQKWNSIMSSLTTCQPCLSSVPAYRWGSDNANNYGRRLEEGDAGSYTSPFTCNDDGGYQDVNQCMLFTQNTETQTATPYDLSKAANQGTIKGIPYAVTSNRRFPKIFWWGLAYLSLASIITSCLCCRKVKSRSPLRKPLVAEDYDCDDYDGYDDSSDTDSSVGTY